MVVSDWAYDGGIKASSLEAGMAVVEKPWQDFMTPGCSLRPHREVCGEPPCVPTGVPVYTTSLG